MTTSTLIGQSQRNKETGEPDDATSITSGSAGGWEKRPKGPRSQPTQLQRSRSTFSWGSFLSFFAFQEGMLGIQISAREGWPIVSEGLHPHIRRTKSPDFVHVYRGILPMTRVFFLASVLCLVRPTQARRVLQRGQ